jgi:predicted transcriptional regulator
MFVEKITIIRFRKPSKTTLNEELQWFGSSLGLFNLRDKDRSCFRVFIELLKAAKMQAPMSSDEIAKRLNLSRATVVHHINNLIERGMVLQIHDGYIMRTANLKELMEELKRDSVKAYEELERVAEQIDAMIGL